MAGKKKSTKIGKLSLNLSDCLKPEPSQFTLPVALMPKYQRGKEVPQLKVS